ncbi:phospho-sugar mutase [Canibacter sp. lx-72]|uniref:phospho-sugar mutase n=1 Tax=Canibacter zhuwentaonis TaxID=2837491 RepID=UPI001BDD76E6|nr:phospho-sugar mutase [Canibacter zhuwentaonis]MBT1018605.1 phospho-sugar mutase [Canibacter zhuwentaonis]
MRPAEFAALCEKAQAWLASDHDPETRAELAELLQQAKANSIRSGAAAQGDTALVDKHSSASRATALAELTDRFAGRLCFGTAGLRAKIGAGPKRMNSVVVKQSTAGFAEFLLDRMHKGKISDTEIKVVVGYDARKKSAQFAQDTAQTLAGYGITALLMPAAAPTPVTAFAVRHLKAAAGIMITASHNPPADNGYKVYLGDADNGSQIVTPDDKTIASNIARIAERELQEIPSSSKVTELSTFIFTEYIAANLTSTTGTTGTTGIAAGSSDAVAASHQPRTVYTAMHGVGAEITRRLFDAAGFDPLYEVAEQNTPDAAFSTVTFPNPEEPGALDLAFARAAEVAAELIIAHDPDADRLAVALPARGGGYTALTGNQLGLLLGWQAAERYAADSNRKVGGALACTIVSSPALRAVAEHYGMRYAETLSGFKWISRVPNLVFGFEEALGYLVSPDVVGDKDGISAAVAIVKLATELKVAGKTLWDRLDEASILFGHYESGQISLRLPDQAAAAALVEKLRANPPAEFDGIAVSTSSDLLRHELADMRANVLRYDLSDGSRIMIRPSGTEPKLKLYIDTLCKEGTLVARQEQAQARLAALKTAAKELLRSLQS